MRIFHGSGSFLTGSDLGEALLLYANALTVLRQSDTVAMLVVDEQGRRHNAAVVVGYGSPVVGVPAHVVGGELVDPLRLDVMRRRTNDLLAPIAESRLVR